MKRLPPVSALALILLGAAACQDRGVEPPQVELGVTRCQRCQRVINDLRWAAADRDDAGMNRVFDDPGCLFALRRERGGSEESSIFHDHASSGTWLRGADTWFAAPLQGISPAGFGWAAYASFGEAQDAVTAAGGGRILRYEQAASVIGGEPDSGTGAAP